MTDFYRKIWHSTVEALSMSDLGLLTVLVDQANHKDSHVCKRGQLVTSYGALAKRMKSSRSTARSAIHRLEKRAILRTASRTLGTVITICDFDRYDSPQTKSAQAADTPNYSNISKSIIADLNRFTKTAFNPEAPAHKKLIDKWIEAGYIADDFKLVHEFKHRDWKGWSDRGRNMKPSVLYSEKNFETYVAEARDWRQAQVVVVDKTESGDGFSTMKDIASRFKIGD